MNDVMDEVHSPGAGQSAVRFTGFWTEFLPIALTNFLLTLVTLGIYRFWAKARERRYLWSRTEFIDDSLAWTGTGLEMFLGFLVVMLVLIPAFLVLNFGIQALVLRGQAALAGVIAGIFYVGLFYMIHVARFRSLRYRLSRTYWHGIRGGADDGGWAYGWSGIWKSFVGILVLGLLLPWSMTSLWNDRWNKMSFGPHRFESWAHSSGLVGRWLLLYLAPVIGFLFIGALVGGAAFGLKGMGAGTPNPAAMVVPIILGVVGFYFVLLLFGVAYYAAYFRQVVQATSIANLTFELDARTKDWLLLILGHIGLVIITLGFGALFISYRNWKFAVGHLHAFGELDLDALTQSLTHAPQGAEGLADAFDIGAI